MAVIEDISSPSTQIQSPVGPAVDNGAAGDAAAAASKDAVATRVSAAAEALTEEVEYVNGFEIEKVIVVDDLLGGPPSPADNDAVGETSAATDPIGATAAPATDHFDGAPVKSLLSHFDKLTHLTEQLGESGFIPDKRGVDADDDKENKTSENTSKSVAATGNPAPSKQMSGATSEWSLDSGSSFDEGESTRQSRQSKNYTKESGESAKSPAEVKDSVLKFNDELLSRFKAALDKSQDPSASEEEEELKNDEDMKKVLENLRLAADFVGVKVMCRVGRNSVR